MACADFQLRNSLGDIIDDFMRRSFYLLWGGFVLVLLGCAPQEPVVSPIAEVDDAAIRREQLFGAEAKATDILWRSSGLGIRLMVPGDGAAPKLSDTVRVHYIGRLKDGQVFDDSHARGLPSEFVVNQLISGWAAAMPTIKPGGRAVFFIPPSLGYGSYRTAKIPANSGLIFEVELIAVKSEATP